MVPAGDCSDIESELDNEASEESDELNVENEQIQNSEPRVQIQDKSSRINPITSTDRYRPAQLSQKMDDNASPYERVKQNLTDELMNFIAEQTNVYSVEKSSTSTNTNKDEIEKFFAIILYSGIIETPSYRDYWSPKTRVSCIADIMGLTRFEKLKQYFHCCDNSLMKEKDDPLYGPLFKVRCIFDSVRERCRPLRLEENLCIDEQIIPFKGRHSLKQYVPGKPHPLGFKLISRSSSNGLLYDFILHAGKHTEMVEPLESFSRVSNIIRTLCKSIPSEYRNIQLHMDNYYKSKTRLILCCK